ncbi:DUF4974 domain-containing protein [Chitinophagaceae bacterium LB-8]|uniref:DUF4974 domain-containing protein n=1 Tax=Paraflavisolibacter caeni TaxID=2982496 RepID=A0A9X2XP23_9BACT|nr:FecR family protein [Paraflavisolibacter caeni]MCU7549719.1 DUF4974 domain-containing protein [Paraflavisolibacter caeni]
MTNERITGLIIKHLEGQLTEAEENELEGWMNQSEHNRQIAEEFLDDNKLKEGLQDVLSKKTVWARLEQETGETKVIPMQGKWSRWVAAAAIVLLMGAGVFYMKFRQTQSNTPIAIEKPKKQNDVAPPHSVDAVIILSNGQKIILDSAGNGTMAMQESVNVVKLADGQIAYNGTSHEMVYNTLVNPRGSKVVSLTLSDGTKVWLNNESSLHYPIAFAGGERMVEVSGEAYFEVAHDASKPFLVKKGDMQVQVLGTHFNVNAFEDESHIKVTLLQGSVKVKNKNSTQLLMPGQQAQLNKKGQIQLDKDADVEQVMAWKNGLFNFSSLPIQSIMHQISRWYDVEVVYEGKISTEHFSGIVSRNDNISEVLKMMQLAGIKFKIEAKRIVVMQ